MRDLFGGPGPSETNLTAILSTIVHPTRRAILVKLADGARTASQLAVDLKLKAPAVYRHIKMLRFVGLVAPSFNSAGRELRRGPIVLKPLQLQDIVEWLEPFRPFWKTDIASAA